MNTNILSDAILSIARLLLRYRQYHPQAERLIAVAHDLWLCPDCGVRPCGCEIPFI